MAGNLDEYKRKRDFERTLEPEGHTEQSEEGLRFVIQHHMARKEHYDLRLEWGGALLSWAVPKGPSYSTKDKRLAVQVEDHPLDYRHFEGTIPKGEYGGGTVMIWDEGTWEPAGDVETGLRDGSLKFALHGIRLKGKWALVRLKAKEGETKDNWLLLKEKDAYARESDGIEEFTTSARTSRSMEEIEAGAEARVTKNPFSITDVQLAKLVREVPEGDDWLYELKYDGYRILAYLEGSTIRLMTRNGHDYTKRFQAAANALLDWASGRAMVLDGEMAVIDASGKTDFQALQNHLKNPKAHALTYLVFDLLALDGEDLRGRRLVDRKEILEGLMKGAPNNLHYSQHVRGHGKESLAAACELGMEGIVGKKAGSPYSGTRNGDWIKLKCDNRQEFVIGGYTLTDKKTEGISALLLGVYTGDDLVYTGRAGTGLSQAEAKGLLTQFEGLRNQESPFREAPKPKVNEEITWLLPRLVAEIKFAEWTEENLLRQASFQGLRVDKDARQVTMEKTDGDTPPPPNPNESEASMQADSSNSALIGGVRITNPDKVIFTSPHTTKADVVRYYEAVSTRMMPYTGNRILSIVCCPKGISSSCFYKKHPGPDSKGIVTIPITNSDGQTEEYFYVNDPSGLMMEAQMGTLEFHTWGSRVDDLEKPDLMVFDLDPDEGMDLTGVRQGVRDLKSILAELSLVSYLKTSGGKGYHVAVPLRPSVPWGVFHDFARRVAEVMEAKWPDRYTSNVRKAKRVNKIFIDWMRNGRGATSIAPYSIRAREGARVSMPIAWEELDAIAPDGIHMADGLERIQGKDPWLGFFETTQSLNTK